MLKVVTETGLSVWTMRRSDRPGGLSQQLMVSVRPEKIRLFPSGSPEKYSHNCYAGRLKQVMYLGPNIQCQVELLTGERLTVLQPNRQKLPAIDTDVQVAWQADDGRSLIV